MKTNIRPLLACCLLPTDLLFTAKNIYIKWCLAFEMGRIKDLYQVRKEVQFVPRNVVSGIATAVQKDAVTLHYGGLPWCKNL